MSPQQQLQKVLADILTYDADDIATILPLAASLVSALCARAAAIPQPQPIPDTDHLVNAQQIAKRLGKSAKWVRENAATMEYAIHVGNEHRFSLRGLDQWISKELAGRMPSALPPGKEAV